METEHQCDGINNEKITLPPAIIHEKVKKI